VLLSTTFNSSRRQVDIMFTQNGIHTLANIVIANPMWIDLLPWSCTTQRLVALDAAQAKEKNYRNWHPINQFLPLAIEVFGYLHKHVGVFLHDYANAVWSLKGSEGPHLSTLVTFLCQKVLITLQRKQASSILSQAIVIGLTTSWLPPLQNTPPITMADLLQAIGFWHVNMANLPQAISYGNTYIFITTLSQLDILSLFPFPLFYSFVHFPNPQCVS
jgi:hypothetical protein